MDEKPKTNVIFGVLAIILLAILLLATHYNKKHHVYPVKPDTLSNVELITANARASALEYKSLSMRDRGPWQVSPERITPSLDIDIPPPTDGCCGFILPKICEDCKRRWNHKENTTDCEIYFWNPKLKSCKYKISK